MTRKEQIEKAIEDFREAMQLLLVQRFPSGGIISGQGEFVTPLNKLKMNIDKQYNEKGDAAHYDGARLQAIVKFERSYGTLAVMTFCEINAEKYRERIGKKPGQSLEQEVLKIEWYERAAKFFFEKLGTADEVIVDNRRKEPLPWKEK